jgi:hypothetical protein
VVETNRRGTDASQQRDEPIIEPRDCAGLATGAGVSFEGVVYLFNGTGVSGAVHSGHGYNIGTYI